MLLSTSYTLEAKPLKGPFSEGCAWPWSEKITSFSEREMVLMRLPEENPHWALTDEITFYDLSPVFWPKGPLALRPPKAIFAPPYILMNGQGSNHLPCTKLTRQSSTVLGEKTRSESNRKYKDNTKVQGKYALFGFVLYFHSAGIQ